MIIDVTQKLYALNGDVLQEPDAKGEAQDVIVRNALVNALLSPVQKESGIDKVKKYELAKRIYANDNVDLSAEDITLIKERVGELFVPLVVGQIFELLEV